MSLDARKSDAELLAMHAEKTAPVINGIVLGPDSPMLKVPRHKRSREERAAEIEAIRRAHADDPVDPNGRMNRTERRRGEELEIKKRARLIRDWRFEPFALRLADSTFYHFDFLIVERDGTFTIEETKGHWRDDARVKIKVAAHQHPYFRFLALRRKRKREGGGWDIEAIKP